MKKFSTLILASLCLFFANSATAQSLPSAQRMDAQPVQSPSQGQMVTPIDVWKTTTDDITSALPTNAVVLWGGPGDPNSEFDGGLNDWTTEGTGGDMMALDAPWTWEEDADVAEGSFAPAAPIASPSAANGAMAFNSDFYDNNGEGSGNIGMGTVPGPHLSRLISPTIDLSNNTEVALNFYTYYRKFQSDVSVSYSNDNGATWSDSIIIHTVNETPLNANAVNREALVYLPGAGGTDEFKVRFTFDGNYYFWMIDDVSIVEAPSHDMSISSFFYTPASYRQPQAHIVKDTFSFSMYVTNAGTEAQTNVVLGAQVRNNNMDVIYETDVTIPEIAAGVVDSSFDIAGTFVPDMLDEGSYFLTYTIAADSVDQWTPDNMDGDQFIVSELLFSKDHINDDFERFSNLGSPWQIGAVYQTAGGFSPDYYTAESITFAGSTNAGDPLEGKTVNVFLLEVSDDIDSGFGNLEDEPYINNPGLTIIGVGVHVYTNEENNDRVTVPVEDIDGGDEVVLQENKRYLALVDYTAAPTIFHGFNNKINFRDRLNFLAFNGDVGGGTWFGGFLDGEYQQPIVQLQLGLNTVNTNDQQLAASTLNVQPNPATDLLTVNIDLETTARAILTVTDITGKIMDIQEFDAVDNQTVSMNVGNYANGTYLVRLATEAGARTVKVVVQH